MANQVFDIALGRVVEYFNKVKANEVPASTLCIMILAFSGLEADGVLKGKATFADLVSGTTNEVTNAGYVKKHISDADLTSYAWAPNTTLHEWLLDIPDQTWIGVGTGDQWARFVVGYDPAGTGVMANILPLTIHDFSVIPDGSDITAQIATTGFFRAS